MKRSQLHAPTLRDNPVDAETISHRLLLRAGFIRPLSSGIYSMLPLGLRVKRKIENIIREEMNAIGGQEFALPSLQPAELWRESGRWNAIGTEMLRLRDRSNREMCLGMTHEEIFTALARELRSYRELPSIWYQVASKFRDEPRPRGGMIRLREFTMKDSYSFAITEHDLDLAFLAHQVAYLRIFERCSVPVVVAEADNGLMGGQTSREFIALIDAGEEWVAVAPSGAAANFEVAQSILENIDDTGVATTVEEFATPGILTIEALVQFGVPANRQIKTLVMDAQGELLLVLLRGDHQLNENKLAHVLGTADIRPAEAEAVYELMGANFGSLGPVRGDGSAIEARVIADQALFGRSGMVSGANRDGYHLRGLVMGRDVQARFADVRVVKDGEMALDESGPLAVRRGLELGHIFKLGTRYASALGASVQNPAGERVPLVMGSYGIGVDRLLAAIAEAHSDERGLVWPLAVAPFAVAVIELGDTAGAAVNIYQALQAKHLEVLYDDRPDRAGVKFTDWELSGIPFAVVVGARGLERGVVEVRTRATGVVEELALAEVVAFLEQAVA
jgi:prolyl-tRNA synthetase